jgi:hypothetical protein
MTSGAGEDSGYVITFLSGRWKDGVRWGHLMASFRDGKIVSCCHDFWPDVLVPIRFSKTKVI